MTRTIVVTGLVAALAIVPARGAAQSAHVHEGAAAGHHAHAAEQFQSLPDGGRIVMHLDSADTNGIRQGRDHMQKLAADFSAGDFSSPLFRQMDQLAEWRAIVANREGITLEYRPLAGGSELRFTARTPEAVKAVHDFLAFQRGQPESAHAHAGGSEPAGARDSAFAAVQARGKVAMGVDQYTSQHRFDALADGGRIELQRDPADTAGVRTIREHLQGIARAFAAGNFETPGFVHDREVPGVRVMTARRDRIRYEFRPLPGGGEVRITARDPDAIAAVHEFLAFQRSDHHVEVQE